VKSSGEDLTWGSVKVIDVMDCINPHRFWFNDHDRNRKLLELMKRMQKFYDNEGKLCKMAPKSVETKMIVAATYNGNWHRGEIIDTWLKTSQCFQCPLNEVFCRMSNR
jgi:hypothetical protein